ncbi:hypothetical protein F511_26857 [Dorcoceras hygrometricum]|uniref:Uncharacterized protein n=1 Tax=Dorcoceras hygrometricum TaxID=472368 RepID=A0A2Z7CUC4_9LAMI|nr:hypothetical protein F511_26857 [Dorcoceras hygrometricum]
MSGVGSSHISWVGKQQVERCFASGAVSQVIQLVVELSHLEVPQEVMLPRRKGRGRGKISEESEGQNEEVQRSIPRRGRDSQIVVDELAARVDDMELVMVSFQQMNPQM